jgi:hypothetical protein
LLSPILGFTATPKIVTTLPLTAPPHDFLLMTLCPQFNPELTSLTSHDHPHRTRAA